MRTPAAQQLPDPVDVDVVVDQLVDHLREVRRPQDRRVELLGHDVCTRFVMYQGEDR